MRIFSYLLIGLLSLALVVAACGASAWLWATHPLALPAETVDFVVDPGASPRAIARQLQRVGVPVWEPGFVLLARLSARDRLIKAGGYQVRRGDTTWSLLERLARGDMSQRQITFLEGWTYKQIRLALRDNPDVRHTLDGVTDAEILARLGSDAKSMEGLIFPDTYVFTPGSTDFDLLRRAYEEGRSILEHAWAGREEGLPLASPYEALILASIIERETGHSLDRRRVAGVFVNRLREGMPLQTDPTVVYGLGDAFQGRLRKKDLQTDTPWNTYTRGGLPPTPIASPGRAALVAALQPERHAFLYFVSRGNGTSEFATNLNDHNRNVARYILGKNQ